MIVSDEYKFIYYDMPKTASMSLDEVFQRYTKVRRPKAKHQRYIPEGKETYIRIGTIRNPYTRMVSMYYQGIKKRFNIAQKSFDHFLDYCLESINYPNAEKSVIANHFPIYKYYSILEPIDYYIRFENIQKDVENLPFVNKKLLIPHRNSGIANKRPFEEFKTPERVEKINKWAGEDFEIYGYTKYSN